MIKLTDKFHVVSMNSFRLLVNHINVTTSNKHTLIHINTVIFYHFMKSFYLLSNSSNKLINLFN